MIKRKLCRLEKPALGNFTIVRTSAPPSPSDEVKLLGSRGLATIVYNLKLVVTNNFITAPAATPVTRSGKPAPEQAGGERDAEICRGPLPSL